MTSHAEAETIIHIDHEPLFALFGENGERWTKGWGNWNDKDAPPADVRTCLHGAIRRCHPVPGDAYIIEKVAHIKGWGVGWNDADATCWSDIARKINSGIDITDADLAETYGQQWREIVAFVRRIASMTTEEIERLAAAMAAAMAAAWDAAGAAAWGAAWAAARAAAWAAAWGAAWAAAMAAAWAAARAAAWDAAWGAAVALHSRDLIGETFSQVQYDLLTGPWRSAVGLLHHEDATLGEVPS